MVAWPDHEPRGPPAAPLNSRLSSLPLEVLPPLEAECLGEPHGTGVLLYWQSRGECSMLNLAKFGLNRLKVSQRYAIVSGLFHQLSIQQQLERQGLVVIAVIAIVEI
jgi:hypothetical protein